MSLLTKREEIAAIVLSGLTQHLNLSLTRSITDVPESLIVKKSVELADALIKKLNESSDENKDLCSDNIGSEE